MMTNTLKWPTADCCAPDYPGGCVCPAAEKALRAWAAERASVAMTPEQRRFCLAEIGQVEGWDMAEFKDASDRNLANGVLAAWTDFCRDKGLM